MRASGILMHISSLPSPYGIGTMGAVAREFVDFLVAAGQTYWQVLPLCPTGFGDSPYQSFSTFAGNPYLIDLDDLTVAGLLDLSDYQGIDWGSNQAAVDYGLLYKKRCFVLRKACDRLMKNPPAEFSTFCQNNRAWLEDYTLFMALKDYHNGASWQEWVLDLRNRDVEALRKAKMELKADIDFWSCVQFLFFQQWHSIKEYANQRNINIIGDLPIYVAGDSAEVWAHPEQFQLDETRMPIEVAGCPPDSYSVDGQLWGNPIYDWDYMERDGYAWWISRICYQCTIYDMLRIDHFRGFDSYYAIPAGATNAKQGHWKEGPGMKLFDAVTAALGPRPIIAEDLGFQTPSVRALLNQSGYPGMKVLEFAFDSREKSNSVYLPHHYPKNAVVYTGTHDNDTVLGWAETALPEDLAYAQEYLHLNNTDGNWSWNMIRAAWQSPADLAIIPMQDILELGSEARMNTPSTIGINWRWKMRPECLSDTLAKKLFGEVELLGRLPDLKTEWTPNRHA